MSRTRRTVKRVDGTEVERPTPEQMRERRLHVAQLLSAGASTRVVVADVVEKFGVTEAQAGTYCQQYRAEARASYESELGGFRSAQRERLYSHLVQARAGQPVLDGEGNPVVDREGHVIRRPDWAAVRGIEKLIGQLEGNFAAIKIDVSTGGETLARVVSGMRPEQVDRATQWAAGRPRVIQGGKGATSPAPSPGAPGGESAAEPGAADRSTG